MTGRGEQKEVTENKMTQEIQQPPASAAGGCWVSRALRDVSTHGQDKEGELKTHEGRQRPLERLPVSADAEKTDVCSCRKAQPKAGPRSQRGALGLRVTPASRALLALLGTAAKPWDGL